MFNDNDLKQIYEIFGTGIRVSGESNLVTPVSLAVSLTPYSIGDSLGGVIQFPDAVRTVGGSGIVQSIVVTDNDNEKAGFDLILFNSSPTAGTYTDNGAVALSTDLSKVIGKINIGTSDYLTIGTQAIISKNVGSLVIDLTGGTILYGVLIATGTPTFTAVGDLSIKLGILKD